MIAIDLCLGIIYIFPIYLATPLLSISNIIAHTKFKHSISYFYWYKEVYKFRGKSSVKKIRMNFFSLFRLSSIQLFILCQRLTSFQIFSLLKSAEKSPKEYFLYFVLMSGQRITVLQPERWICSNFKWIYIWRPSLIKLSISKIMVSVS